MISYLYIVKINTTVAVTNYLVVMNLVEIVIMTTRYIISMIIYIT